MFQNLEDHQALINLPPIKYKLYKIYKDPIQEITKTFKYYSGMSKVSRIPKLGVQR